MKSTADEGVKNRKTYNSVPIDGPVSEKKRGGRRGCGKDKEVEVDDDFKLPYNNEGYVDHCCPKHLLDAWREVRAQFICSYYVCQSIGVYASVDETFLVWMEEKHPKIFRRILERST